VLAGNIRPADRVLVAAGGPPGLAERRVAAVSGELLRYGIVVQRLALDTVPANRAIVSIGRYAVTLPACPNWSQSLAWEFTNAYSSYYGCANETNLGLMVASPADLVNPRPFTGIDGMPAVSAVERYLTDRITPPPAPTASPFAPTTGGAGAGAGAGPGGAPGAAGP
jgi:pilus assembly protein CpaD